MSSAHRSARDRVVALFALALGIAPVVAIYAINPQNRVFSYHGLCHGSVVYLMANGSVPPMHPFLAESPLYYYWGYHGLAAGLVRLFGISPFWAFAAINVGSLVATLVAIHAVAARILADRSAALLGTFVAIYASTGLNVRMLQEVIAPAATWLGFLDWRGAPVIEKFTNASGAPVGVALVAALLYVVVRVAQDGPNVRRAASMASLVAACGFFYPPMLLGFLGVCAAAWIVPLASGFGARRGDPGRWLGREARRMAWIALPCAAGVALVWPYLDSVSAGYAGSVRLFEPAQMLANGANAIAIALPMAFVLALSWRRLAVEAERRALAAVAVAGAITALLYVCVGQSERNEYKYLIVSMLCLGLLGGLGLDRLRARIGSAVVAVAALLLLANPAWDIAYKAQFRRDVLVDWVEVGPDLGFADPRRDEVYAWMRGETPAGSIIIESGNGAPIFGQRALFASVGAGTPCGIDPYTMFRVREPSALAERKRLARALLTRGSLSEPDWPALESLESPVYLVMETRRVPPDMEERWRRVFTSTTGRLSAFRLERRPEP